MSSAMRKRESKYPGGRKYRGRILLKSRSSTTRPGEYRDNSRDSSADGTSSEQEFEDAIGEGYPDTAVIIESDGVPREPLGQPVYPPALPPTARIATTTTSTATQSAPKQNTQQTATKTSSSKPLRIGLPQTPSAPPEPQISIVNAIPSFDHIEPYNDGTSFVDYLERWEILMARYNSNQLALALPAKLSGVA